MIDPNNQQTDIRYDPFGAITSRTVAGQPSVNVAFQYDHLGRVNIENRGSVRIKHIYDQRGDEVLETLLSHGGSYPLIERRFDELGRLRVAKNFNNALDWLPTAERTVTLRLDYDSLGRLKDEALQVGSGLSHPVSSQWALTAGNLWQRKLSYVALGRPTEWLETFDSDGRLSRAASAPGGTD